MSDAVGAQLLGVLIPAVMTVALVGALWRAALGLVRS